jgi:intracellular multiplication protein IcmJ
MKYTKLTLGIARGSVRNASSSQDKKNLDALKTKVFERDDYTCQCCGFRAQKYQELFFRNGDRADQSTKNVMTTCIFCAQVYEIDRAAEMKSGVLIWLPEIEQHILHHIVRAIYVGRISQGPMAEASRKAQDVLLARREEAKRRLGTDEANIMAMVLRDYITPRHYAQRTEKLKGVRLLPLDRRIIQESGLQFNQFPQILAYWRSKDGPFGGKIPAQWINFYQDALMKANS